MKRLALALFLLLSPRAALAAPERPALYALVVGVDAAALSDKKLRYPAKDAVDLAAALRGQAGRAFRSVEVRALTGAEATRDRVLDGLDWLARATTARDVALVFLAGQGLDEPRTGRYSYVPIDGDLRAVKRTLVSSADLHDALASIAGKPIAVLDACRPGELGPRKLRCSSDLEWLVRAPAQGERPVGVLAAATAGQSAAEDEALGNGALAKALIEGLAGAADPLHTGSVTIEMLDRYVSGRVRELTHGAQTTASANLGTLGGVTLVLVH